MKRLLIYLTLTFFLFNCNSTKDKSSDNNSSASPDYLKTGYYYLSKDSSKFQRQLNGSERHFNLNPKPIITVDNFIHAAVLKKSSDNYYIGIKLDETAGQKWSEATGKNLGDSIAVIINNELIQIAKINAQITESVTAINKTGMTKEQAEKYLEDIKASMTK